MGEETTKTLYVNASFTKDECGEEWGVTKFASLGDAIASANEAGVDTVIELQSDVVNETVQDYATTVALTINGNEFKMKNVHLNPKADLVLDKIAFEGDSTVNAATACKSLTITNCSANVTPSREGNHPAFVNIGQGEGNETTALSLTMTGNNILVNNESAGYGKAVFGWRYLNSVTISDNTFGSKTAPVEQRAVKLMNFTDGAKVVIEGNTIYGTDAEREFVAIDLYQNNSRKSNYIAEISGNTVVNVNKAAGNGFFFAFVESNCYQEDFFGNGSVQIMADNTLNSKAVAVGNVKVNSNEREYDYIGVGVTKDENGKITGGTFIIGADGKADLMDDVALGLIPVDSDADGFWTLQSADRSTLYVDANAKTDVEAGKILGFNLFTTSKDAMAAAMELGGATINVDGMGNDLNGTNTVKFNNAGNYVITGGNKNAVLYGLSIMGTGVNLKFEDAVFSTGKFYGAAAGSTFTVTDSVIGAAAVGKTTAASWMTFMSSSVSIDNSVFGARLNNIENVTDMPRSASDVKASEDYKFLTYGSNAAGYHFGTFGKFNVEDSTMITGYCVVADRAEMSLKNSVLYYGGTITVGKAMNDNWSWSETDTTGWDAQVGGWGASAEDFRVGQAATMNIEDSIVRNIGWGNGNANNCYVQVGGYYNEKSYAGVLNITRSDFSTDATNANNDKVVVKDNGVINITDSKFDTAELVNGGTVKVFGASDIKAAVSGDGWMYMNNVKLDKDTQITGANIRFASGNNVIDGATINTKDALGVFQVGSIDQDDANVDFKKPITVTVKNSTIASGTAKKCCYVGKNNTLAIENSSTYFQQVNSYGNFSITGDTTGTKFSYSRGDVKGECSTYVGTFNVFAGEATLKDTSFHALNNKIHGKLTVDGSNAYFTGGASFNTGLNVFENAVLSVKNSSVVYANNFDNAGTITLDGENTMMILTGVKKTGNVTTPGEHNNQKNIEILNNATLTDNGVEAILNNSGTITVNGGSLNVTNLNNSGKVVFENGGIDVQKLDNKNSITVDAAACITVDTFTNSGVVNICVDGLNAGSATVIDAKADTADFGKVQFVDGDGKAVSGYATLIDKTNGDLIVYKAAEETIYVNAEWTGKSFGETITYGDKTIYYGIDAFDTLSGVTASDATTNLVIAGGQYKTTPDDLNTSVLKGGINKVTTAAATDQVVVNGGNLIFATDYAGKVTVEGNYSTTAHCGWDYDLGQQVWRSGHIRFQGGAETEFVINCKYKLGLLPLLNSIKNGINIRKDSIDLIFADRPN